MSHLGNAFATAGFVSAHIQHGSSDSNLQHRLDRPADVSFVLDQLESPSEQAVATQNGFSIDFERVGHCGHSWGAMTSMAVAGGYFDHAPNGELRDERIRAHVALSPQGDGGFGAFDRSATDNTWFPISIPHFSLLGSAEKDGPVGNANQAVDWRLQPYLRMDVDKHNSWLAVLDGQTHSDLGGSNNAGVDAYVASNAALFFDVHLNNNTARLCEIGQLCPLEGTDFRRKLASGLCEQSIAIDASSTSGLNVEQTTTNVQPNNADSTTVANTDDNGSLSTPQISCSTVTASASILITSLWPLSIFFFCA